MSGYQIPKETWDKYISMLRQIDEKAAQQMTTYIAEHGAVVDEAMVDYAYSISSMFGEGAGSLAADMYNSIAEYWMEHSSSGRNIPAAEVAETATRREVQDALYSAQAQNRQAEIPQRVSRLVRQTGADTMTQNAIRDHAQWAWIPGGGETCAFCLMLASRGWTDASKNVLKGNHAEHIHNNCDCAFAIRFDDSMDVEGYDPDEILERFDNVDGDSWTDKVNAMRREMYPQIKDARNARRRELG